jgi:hypothetical protein
MAAKMKDTQLYPQKQLLGAGESLVKILKSQIRSDNSVPAI